MLPDILAIGPFMIRSTWLALMIGGLIGLFLIKMKSKKVIPEKAEALDNGMINSLIIFVLVWKFSPVLTNPGLIWEQPSALLFMSPGMWSVLAGIVAAAIFFSVSMTRGKIPWMTVLDLSPYFWSSMLLVYNLLVPRVGNPSQLPWAIHYKGSAATFHPVHYYLAIVAIFIMIYLLRTKNQFGKGIILSQTLFLLGAGGLIVTFFSSALEHLLGLTAIQWFYVIILMISLFLQQKVKKSDYTINQ